MRRFAADKNADWTLFLTECYMKRYDETDDYQKDARPIREQEGREEGVIFTLETKADGDYLAATIIKYKADKKVLPEVTFEEQDGGSQGTFTNLLTNKVKP
jgi:hypothetical protein